MKRFRQTILDAARFIGNNPSVVRQYKDVFRVGTEKELPLLEKYFLQIYPTSWDAVSSKFVVVKDVEFSLIQPISLEETTIQ